MQAKAVKYADQPQPGRCHCLHTISVLRKMSVKSTLSLGSKRRLALCDAQQPSRGRMHPFPKLRPSPGV